VNLVGTWEVASWPESVRPHHFAAALTTSP